jgi:hypothetical protein
MTDIPTEIYLEIIEYLSLTDWVNLHLTSKHFKFMESHRYVKLTNTGISEYNVHGILTGTTKLLYTNISGKKFLSGYVKRELGVITESYMMYCINGYDIGCSMIKMNDTIYLINKYAILNLIDTFDSFPGRKLKRVTPINWTLKWNFPYIGIARSPIFQDHICEEYKIHCEICWVIAFIFPSETSNPGYFCKAINDFTINDKHIDCKLVWDYDREEILSRAAKYNIPLYNLLKDIH